MEHQNDKIETIEKRCSRRHEQLRNLLLHFIVIATFPVWLSVYARIFSFQTVAALLSLIPGLLGFWLRRSFYYMTLDNAPTDISVSFGSRFLGRGVRLGHGVWVGNWTSINDCVIGKGTLISSYVDMFSGAHQHGDGKSLVAEKSKQPMRKPKKLLTIGENVWIGSGATVFADVGNNTIIGAGSVVVKPIPANCVAVGNPARALKPICCLKAAESPTEVY